MIDGDIRALLVKMLSEDQLRRLHDYEAHHGGQMASTSITAMFRLESIKTYYRVTASPLRSGRVTNRVLREWAARVRAVMERFCRETQVRYSGDLNELHAYDRTVWASDLDFYFRTATAAKRTTGWRTNLDHPTEEARKF